jgi:nucleoside-triphosphatase
VGKYGVSLDNLHEVALTAMEPLPGIELMVVDEIGKMECLSSRFLKALERLWAAPVPLLATVSAAGGGFIRLLKEKPDKIMITVTLENREKLPERILTLLRSLRGT